MHKRLIYANRNDWHMHYAIIVIQCIIQYRQSIQTNFTVWHYVTVHEFATNTWPVTHLKEFIKELCMKKHLFPVDIENQATVSWLFSHFLNLKPSSTRKCRWFPMRFLWNCYKSSAKSARSKYRSGPAIKVLIKWAGLRLSKCFGMK